MRSCHTNLLMPCILALALGADKGSVRAGTPLVDPDSWTPGSLSVVADGGSARNINATFAGKPWVEYAVFATSDFTTWAPLGLAPEGLAGDYFFHHSSAAGAQFYHAEITLPGPIKTLDAHFYGGMAGLWAAAQRFGLAYNRETEHAIGGAKLNLGQQIEQASQSLMGQVNVVDLQNGSFQVSWAGSQQVVNGPAARDAAAQNYQQQRNATQAQLALNQASVTDLGWMLGTTLAVEPLAVEEADIADCEASAISTYLPLPTGAVFLPYDAPLAWFDLDTAALDKAAVEKEKAALQQRTARLRQEATRKRQLASGATQVFGIAGMWFVRWANVELTFPTEAQAQSTGVGNVNAVKLQRIAEADALDAEADALEAQLPALDAKLASLTAALAVLTPAYQAKLAADPPGGVPKPVDTNRPRARYRVWIGFPPDFVDPMWDDLYREWQARKDALRNELQAMGASQSEIDDALGGMDGEIDPRRKWMSVFFGEPIHLELLFVNQFTGMTIDSAGAKWEVEYENHATGQLEKVQVGEGGTLDIPSSAVEGIFDHAKDVQNQSGNSVLVSISVTFNRVFPDGKVVPTKVTQQVIITNYTRAEHDAKFGGLPR